MRFERGDLRADLEDLRAGRHQGRHERRRLPVGVRDAQHDHSSFDRHVRDAGSQRSHRLDVLGRIAGDAYDQAPGRQPPPQRRRPIERQQPFVEHGDAIRQTLGLVEIVRRHEDRAAGCPPLLEQPANHSRHLWIESRRRLVEEQDRRIVQERAGQRDPLPQAFRQFGGARRCAIGQLEHLERAIDRLLGVRKTVETGVDAQVLANSEPIPETRGLGEKPDAAAQRRPRRLREPHAVNRHRPAGRRDQPCQHPQRRGLAGAVGAQQRDDFRARDRERDVVDHGARSEAAGQAGGCDHEGRTGRMGCPAPPALPAQSGSNSNSPGVTRTRPFFPKNRLFGAMRPAPRNWTVRVLSPSPS